MIAAAMAIDVGMQLASGNFDVGGDLVDAFVDGLDKLAWGFASRFERDFTKDCIAPFGLFAPLQRDRRVLWYATTTQAAPAADDEGNVSYGPGGFVDQAHNQVPDFNR
jgi:hypothetical protein